MSAPVLLPFSDEVSRDTPLAEIRPTGSHGESPTELPFPGMLVVGNREREKARKPDPTVSLWLKNDQNPSAMVIMMFPSGLVALGSDPN